jgi:hypothetical protein
VAIDGHMEQPRRRVVAQTDGLGSVDVLAATDDGTIFWRGMLRIILRIILCGFGGGGDVGNVEGGDATILWPAAAIL